MTPALLLVGHGSRDARFADAVRRVADATRRRLPGTDVAISYLDLTAPSVGAAIADLAAVGHRSVVAVPLLFSEAFHARTDLPGILAAARVAHPGVDIVQADVLGHDDRIVTALADRALAALLETRRTGPAPMPLALSAVGSSDPSADAATIVLAGRVAAALGRTGATTLFATREPSVEPGPLLVAPLFISDGLLTERLATRLAALGVDATIARPLADHPLLIDVVVDRYRAAVEPPVPARCGSRRS